MLKSGPFSMPYMVHLKAFEPAQAGCNPGWHTSIQVCLPVLIELCSHVVHAALLQMLLTAAVKDSETELLRLPLLADEDAKAILEGLNPSSDEQEIPQTCLHNLFEQQADRQPHAPCIRTPKETLNYEQVEQRANALAHALQSMGVGSDSVVGVMLERGLDLYVAILAVLKAGAAYLPMDSAYPEDRLKFMASDAAIQVLVTTEDLAKVVQDLDVQVRHSSTGTHHCCSLDPCTCHLQLA